MPDLNTILQNTDLAHKPTGTTVETPSGLSIYYEPEPDRHYKVNGVRVPSVTEVMGVLHKPALIWWGMKVGIEGLQELAAKAGDEQVDEWDEKCAEFVMQSVEVIIKELTKNKLTVNHVRDKAGSRGTSVHNAFERYCLTGHKPMPEEFPEEERGYVEGLLKFIWAVNPEPIECEVMVGSAEKGFAGRFDLLASTEEKLVNPTPRKKRNVPGGKGIWDLKTGKGIYDTHHLQTAAYRFAMEESHGIRSDYEAIVNVREDGSWDVEVSDKQPWQFLAVREAWGVLR